MNQVLNNPFPYSSDNKRYHTFSYYLKNHFGQKTAKIPLNAGFSCPNRDGAKGIGGCTFCTPMGSGDTILNFRNTLQEQYEANLQRARSKWPDCLGMAYFQSYTNTYAPLEQLKEIYTPFYQRDDIAAVCIATRADCLDEEKIAWFAKQPKETWMEIGLQTSNEKTAKAINRAHSTKEVAEALALCHKHGIKTCLHIINGLPGDTREDMLETARFAARHKPDAIKIHMLHLLKDTVMGKAYELKPFHLLSMEEYVQIVCDQLELLPADMVIERVTGDGLAQDLIAPLWTIKKTAVANEIDKELLRRNSWQSKYFENEERRNDYDETICQ